MQFCYKRKFLIPLFRYSLFRVLQLPPVAIIVEPLNCLVWTVDTDI